MLQINRGFTPSHRRREAVSIPFIWSRSLWAARSARILDRSRSISAAGQGSVWFRWWQYPLRFCTSSETLSELPCEVERDIEGVNILEASNVVGRAIPLLG